MSNQVNDLFVVAARKKFRFETSRGQLSIEDLWDLSLESLDKVAVSLDEKVQKAGGKSFIGKRTTGVTDLTNQLEVVKFIIETKLAEQEERKTRAEKASQKVFLQELLEKKRMAQLEGLSVDEIQKQLDQLGE